MALMGKKSKSVIRDSVKSANPIAFQPPEEPVEVTVRKADNEGFIVKKRGGKDNPYPGKEYTAADKQAVVDIMETCFGKSKKD